MRYGLALPGMLSNRYIQEPRKKRSVNHGAVTGAFTAATGFVRSLCIRPYEHYEHTQEAMLLAASPKLVSSRCSVYRERGNGDRPTIVIGGFVPDSTEVVEFQRPLLRRYGSIYYVNYPLHGFSTSVFRAQLTDLIESLSNRKQRPVIMAVSFGCGLLVDFLTHAHEKIHQAIKGLLLVSPVLGVDDLVRTKHDRNSGMRMLEHNLTKILEADPSDDYQLDRQIERARRCFQALFEAGAGARSLTPRHLSLRKQIFGVLEGTSNAGGYQRVLALQNFTKLAEVPTIFSGPAQIMFAESEADILAPLSPVLKLSVDHQRLRKLFPDGRICTVRSKDVDDSVAHASLIFHEQYFNPRIASWFERLHRQPLLAMVG